MTEWIRVEDETPKNENVVKGYTSGEVLEVKYHIGYKHFLEYSGRRKRWEFTVRSNRITSWKKP